MSSIVSSESGQIEYVCWVNPTCAVNTAASAYTTTAVPISLCQLWRAEFRIPPGHQGLTGIALWDSGSFIVPYSASAPAWLVGDDDDLTYPYDKELGANVQLATYNTDDTYDHGWQVRLIYTPMSAIDAGGEPIVVPASLDWLTGTPGGG
jgi:hypothetical protein